jgi:hypothetical protein
LRTSSVLALACLFASASAASAAVITFSGTFGVDNDVVYFRYSIDNPGEVTVSTTSFAGGGFSPILTLFDSSGVYQSQHSGYGSNSEATLVDWPSSIGGEEFIITLTQYDNFALGPNLSDGFTYDGQGNFTSVNSPFPGGSFLLPGPEQRTAEWSIEFSSPDATLYAVQVPEPSTSSMALFGGVALAAWLSARRRNARSNPAEPV